MRACPYCESETHVIHAPNLYRESGDGYYVDCRGCLSSGPVRETEADAILAWWEEWIDSGPAEESIARLAIAIAAESRYDRTARVNSPMALIAEGGR